MSVILGTSWYFDSSCCNHMTSNSSIISSKIVESPSSIIHTVDGSHMQVSHVGHVSTLHLTLPHTYVVPKLTLNLISRGQLCELGLELILSINGCRI